ncbi:conjugal transfer protein TraF, partial [Thalassospira sp. CH_XMU1420-2]|uniref:conjugal transfer protein TraF n=1 Tax=Thalassospira sp. CH_XMU1420-2 TaxID=3107769 RepID=UPI00300A774C
MKKRIIASLAVLALHASASAQTYPVSKAPGPASGWHFYDDPEPVPEKEELEPQPSQVLGTPEREAPPAASNSEGSGPSPMSAEWLKANMPRLLNQALDNPTRENVEAYYGAQRVMMDKAERVHVRQVISETLKDIAEAPQPIIQQL